MVGTAGSYETQNSNWSQTGNSPHRDYKGAPYEGGISAPFIAWYPQKIKASSISQGTAHLIDLAPTFYELAGAKYPSVLNGVSSNALPGKSLLPVLTGKAGRVERGEPLFWERGGNKAVRDGDWKLVSSAAKGEKYELFNIAEDRAENLDVAAQHPDIVARLKAAYAQWAEKNGVVDYNKLKSVPVRQQGAPNRGNQNF
ncbi:sulfatase [Pedobacter sp.]|uniref:sulfatase family protein n=1 Tax=Pedobacter sp. TaxID=1411316 RepID=UPI003BAC684B